MDNLTGIFYALNRQEDIDQVVNELSVQFRKLGLTDESRLDALFLKYNKDRLCYLDIENLKDICRKLQLPQDEDVLNRVSFSIS